MNFKTFFVLKNPYKILFYKRSLVKAWVTPLSFKVPTPQVYLKGLNLFNLKAFNTTETELKLIAAAAIIGFNNGPPNRCRMPIATGMPKVL